MLLGKTDVFVHSSTELYFGCSHGHLFPLWLRQCNLAILLKKSNILKKPEFLSTIQRINSHEVKIMPFTNYLFPSSLKDNQMRSYESRKTGYICSKVNWIHFLPLHVGPVKLKATPRLIPIKTPVKKVVALENQHLTINCFWWQWWLMNGCIHERYACQVFFNCIQTTKLYLRFFELYR